MTRTFSALLLAAALAVAAAAQTPAPDAVQPVIVSLRSDAAVDADVVRLGDIAYLYAGDARKREAMLQLDLADTRHAAGKALSRDAVKFRLLIAGHAEADFRITGAAQTLVRGAAPGRAPAERRPTTPVSAALPASAPAAPPASDAPPVVKTRDRVRLLAHVGPVNVVVAGEALQDGRMGQSIRVRNIDSNKIILGRVTGPGLVEVEY
jgi:hypothetical protein